MISALWTGLLVAAVKLAPLILICIKLVFKAILPLVGMSLLNRSTQDVQVQSAVVQPAFAPVVQPAFQPVVQPVLQPAFQRVHQFMPLMTSDTTTTTFQQDVDVDDDTMLDNEFESIKRHFYR
uniref:Putative secreted protein n=2 Tax=Lutzomyia longipalpis TaxID=7200 RepID=A0A7G3AGZ1_LUTLO